MFTKHELYEWYIWMSDVIGYVKQAYVKNKNTIFCLNFAPII